MKHLLEGSPRLRQGPRHRYITMNKHVDGNPGKTYGLGICSLACPASEPADDSVRDKG